MPEWPFEELYGPQFSFRHIRQGKVFQMWHTVTIPAGGTHDVQLKTADKIIIDQQRFDIVDATPVIVELFEVDSLTDGTEFNTTANLNRFNSEARSARFFDSPTNLTGATKIDESRIVGSASGPRPPASVARPELRFLLKRNTDYVSRITNNTSQTITHQIVFFWIELLPSEFILA